MAKEEVIGWHNHSRGHGSFGITNPVSDALGGSIMLDIEYGYGTSRRVLFK